MRTILRLLLWIAGIVAVLVATAIWWFVYRPLPQLDGSAVVPGLHSDVTVERDNWGVPHIRAASVEDLAEAQGYVTAQDRLWQMDLLRRAARGQLSEVLGPATLKIDKDFRLLNFSRSADVDFGMMSPEVRRIMEAYARGVNLYAEQHMTRLPIEFTLLNYKPQPWKPTDSLVIGCYMYRTLTDTREEELGRAIVTAKVGPELAKDLYSPEASMDHFVVGDPGAEKDSRTGAKSDDDHRRSRQRESFYIPLRRRQMNLIPDRWQGQFQMHVVGEERLAGGRVLPVHHPVVAPQGLTNLVLRFLEPIQHFLAKL